MVGTTDRLTAALRDHPRLVGAIGTALFLLSQASSAAANYASTIG